MNVYFQGTLTFSQEKETLVLSLLASFLLMRFDPAVNGHVLIS